MGCMSVQMLQLQPAVGRYEEVGPLGDIRSWEWHPHDEISALIKREKDTRFSSLIHVRILQAQTRPLIWEINLLAPWSWTSQLPELWEIHCCLIHPGYNISLQGFPGDSDSKNLPAIWKTQVRFQGPEDPLKKGTAIHSSNLAWRIPWTEELGGHSPWGRKESNMTEQLTLSL